jgi:hypothetical protein
MEVVVDGKLVRAQAVTVSADSDQIPQLIAEGYWQGTEYWSITQNLKFWTFFKFRETI